MTLRPKRSHCACGLRGHVQKTRGKEIHFPAATVHVRETRLFCPQCRHVWGCPEYDALTPPKANISWGLITWIGQRRFHQNRQIQEIQEDLQGRGIHIGASTIVRASDTYLERYAALHDDKDLWEKVLLAPVVWEMDGTTEDGGGLVFVVRCQGYTITAAGIPSEAERHVEGVLEEAKSRTNAPVAVGRDFSQGSAKAQASVVAGAVQIGCHFHFLRDAGTDALQEAHVAVLRALAKDGLQARLQALARRCQGEWGQRVASVVAAVFQSPGGLAFPFRLPALERLERLEQAYTWACQALRDAAAENRHLPEVVELKEILARYRWDADKPREVARLVQRHGYTLRVVGAWFRQVRDALGVFRTGPQDEEAACRVDQVVRQVEEKANAMRGRERGLGLKLVAAVRKRRQELLAPVVVDGEVVRVERTIVDTERSHRQWKRGVRRRTGRPRVRQELRHHGVALAFVANWEREAFREALGGVAGLVGKIKRVDEARLRKAREALRGMRPPAGARSAGRRLAGGGRKAPSGMELPPLQEANR